MQYSEAVRRHFERPANVGPPEWTADAQGQAGSVETGLCIRFWLSLDGADIRRAAFAAYGCPHAIAVASWIAGHLAGQRLPEACRLDLPAIAEALGLPAEKWRCVLVAEDALAACLDGAGL